MRLKKFKILITSAALLFVINSALSAPAVEAPKWLAALYIEAQDSVGLRWAPVPGATAYKVLRSEVKGKDYKEIAGVTVTQFMDKGIKEDRTYYYVLKTVAGAKLSPVSEEKKVVVPSREAALPSPVLKSVTRRAVTEFGKTSYRVNIDWEPVDGAAAYNVYRSTEKDKGYSMVGSTTDTKWTDKNVKTNDTYYYKLTTLNGTFRETGLDSVNEERIELPDPDKYVKSEKARPALEFYSGGGFGFGGYSTPRIQAKPGSFKPSYEGFGQVFDEVWVIQKAEGRAAPPTDEKYPGTGELQAVLPGEKEKVPMPLKHTGVTAGISGYIASVLVKQEYENPYDEKIEAVYVFPLPQNAAVTDFVMVIGDRRIRGIIREREEAERVYEAARKEGLVASLLTQERPNIFTQKVANIEPGKEIDVEIFYFNTLAYLEGEYTFVFPMVVGPRYNPPGFTEGVGAVGRGSRGISGQQTEIEYLRPEERSGHDIGLSVDLDAGVDIEKIYSNSHAIDVEKKGKSAARVTIRPADRIPNKDFVLRYRVAGKKVKTAMMVHRDGTGGYFTLMLQPPGNLKDLPRTPKEMVFVLDCSGSMSGWPIEKSKAAMRRVLKKLDPDDTFQIIRFSNRASALGGEPIPATPDNIEKGLEYIDSLRGSGGTQMIEGIKAALDFPHDPKRFRIVSFLTDGYIGNEVQILRAVDEKLGESRIFSFGIGNSVNRYLIERMAKIGRGAVAYILTTDSDTEAVDLFYDRIGHPALTDISIDWGSMKVTDVYPKVVPDMFVGRPVVLTGRFEGHGETTVKIAGRNSGQPQTMKLEVSMDDPGGRHKGISKIWARARIADLMDAMAATGSMEMKEEVRETALAHSLVSAYTAFVAVDSTRRTEGDHGTTVKVPVPVPDGVRYETTVEEK